MIGGGFLRIIILIAGWSWYYARNSKRVKPRTYPSPPSTGSLISRRKSAWWSWISLIRWGFCFPSSWSIGCHREEITQSPSITKKKKKSYAHIFANQPKMIFSEEEWLRTCKICGLACTIVRRAWNWKRIKEQFKKWHNAHRKESMRGRTQRERERDLRTVA